MKLSATRLQALKIETIKNIEKLTSLLKDKKRILDAYGYEEKGEEVSKYERMIKDQQNVLNDIENGVFSI